MQDNLQPGWVLLIMHCSEHLPSVTKLPRNGTGSLTAKSRNLPVPGLPFTFPPQPHKDEYLIGAGVQVETSGQRDLGFYSNVVCSHQIHLVRDHSAPGPVVK